MCVCVCVCVCARAHMHTFMYRDICIFDIYLNTYFLNSAVKDFHKVK